MKTNSNPTVYAAIAAILPTLPKPTDALCFADRLEPDDGESPQFGRTGREGGFGDRYTGSAGEYMDWFYDGDANWEV